MSGKIGDRIRALRKSAGLSQGDLAEKMGAAGNQPLISRWERGHTQPTEESLARLEEILGGDLVSLAESVGKPSKVERKQARGTAHSDTPSVISPELARTLLLSRSPLSEAAKGWLASQLQAALYTEEGYLPEWFQELLSKVEK